jgi:AraC-like DNA-binding protein
MEQQTIYIKGMVCQRCMMTVKEELQNMGHTPLELSLGTVSFATTGTHDLPDLEKRLTSLGFSLLEDKKAKLVKEVKRLVEEVYSGDFDFPERFRFAELAKERFQKDYDTISDAFIAAEKRAIEQFIIDFRINKVKEFLVYSNATLSDIAFKLNFNSVAHLSSQFKQQTGLTPSYFKQVKKHKVETKHSKN